MFKPGCSFAANSPTQQVSIRVSVFTSLQAPIDSRAPHHHKRAVLLELCRVMDKRAYALAHFRPVGPSSEARNELGIAGRSGTVSESDLRSAIPLAGDGVAVSCSQAVDRRVTRRTAGFRLQSDEVMNAFQSYGLSQTNRYDYERWASYLGYMAPRHLGR